MKKLITITSISLAILFSSNILAEGFNDNYFSLGYLNSSGNDVKRKDATSGSLDGESFKNGNGIVLAIGKHLPDLPISIELEYMNLKEDFVGFTTKDDPFVEKGSGSSKRSGVFLTARRHFDSTGIATPHIGFGVGWQKDKYNVKNLNGHVSINDSDSGFSYGFLLGVAFDLNQSIKLNLDYRYRIIDELTVASVQCGTLNCFNFTGNQDKYKLSTLALSISKYF